MDTGADATLIPQAALALLGLQPIADLTYDLIAFDGTRRVASVADLDLILTAVSVADTCSPMRTVAY
jgi:hypothetical protein